jgi:hypothetical protein
MEWLLAGVLAVLVVGWLALRRRSTEPIGAWGVVAGTLPEPSPAAGRGVRLSSFGRVPVLGTGEHQAELAAAARGPAAAAPTARNLPVTAVLVTAPAVGVDRPGAVAVEVDGRQVGRLAPECGYLPVLAYLADRGEVGWCPARLTRGAGGSYGLYLQAGEADVLLPRNDPNGLDLLEAHAPVPVIGTEDTQPILERLLGAAARSAFFAGLELGRIAGGRFDGEPALQVMIGGAVVGHLTASVTQDYLGWVQPVLSAGRRPGAEAVLHRTPRGVQVTVHLPPIAD